MSLSDWEKNGWLKAHQTSREEIQNLLNIVRRDLKDSDSSTEAKELVQTTNRLFTDLLKWLEENFKQYI